MTEHNHRRGTVRKNGPRTRTIVEKQIRQPGMGYMYGRNHTILESTPEHIIHAHEESVSYRRGYDPYRPWRYNPNVNKCFNKVGALSGAKCSAASGFDHSNGHRGEARAVRGAKKYVNSRHRFHENAATRQIAAEVEEDGHERDF